MLSEKQPTGATILETWRELDSRLRDLQKQQRFAQRLFDGLQAAEELLAQLPLTTDQYGLAVQRLRNAARYTKASEIGAASYEMRMLIATLRSIRDEDSVASVGG